MDDERCPLGEHGAIYANIENLKEQVARNCVAVKGKVPWVMFVPVLTILVLIVGSLAGMNLSIQQSVNKIDKNVAVISNEVQHLKEYIQQVTLEEELRPDPVSTWDPCFDPYFHFKMMYPYTPIPNMDADNNLRFSRFTFNPP